VNGEDVARLCRYVQALSPAQRWTEYTPDAWADVLRPVHASYDEAKAATAAVARRQPYIAPADIIAEIRAARDTEARPPPCIRCGLAHPPDNCPC